MTEFLLLNARPLRTFKNYSGTRADKTTWIGTGWRKLVRKYDLMANIQGINIDLAKKCDIC